MHKPSLDELMDKVDSRYTLVVVAAKRARQLTEIALQQAAEESSENFGKPVSAALQEVVQGKIRYKRTKQGIK
ncbi:DNA-directed RNA polymerase subunit omega [Desulfallas sp. Bu1-1]|uniref:DNA-directed RNA polymerase subunit omega n=1 Tax=Desulfallas sp. Bu1-1 TaxID=2787620 RepID=UPI0018A05C87|nr:DNA-directed RNA polymerase subunit omega [Desulfallas sp. Bu1-1]MBF7082315.1 DNA-directed RNA polymerase subunit omega [Desulfallas sp. Bu1-1]